VNRVEKQEPHVVPLQENLTESMSDLTGREQKQRRRQQQQ